MFQTINCKRRENQKEKKQTRGTLEIEAQAAPSWKGLGANLEGGDGWFGESPSSRPGGFLLCHVVFKAKPSL